MTDLVAQARSALAERNANAALVACRELAALDEVEALVELSRTVLWPVANSPVERALAELTGPAIATRVIAVLRGWDRRVDSIAVIRTFELLHAIDRGAPTLAYLLELADSTAGSSDHREEFLYERAARELARFDDDRAYDHVVAWLREMLSRVVGHGGFPFDQAVIELLERAPAVRAYDTLHALVPIVPARPLLGATRDVIGALVHVKLAHDPRWFDDLLAWLDASTPDAHLYEVVVSLLARLPSPRKHAALLARTLAQRPLLPIVRWLLDEPTDRDAVIARALGPESPPDVISHVAPRVLGGPHHAAAIAAIARIDAIPTDALLPFASEPEVNALLVRALSTGDARAAIGVIDRDRSRVIDELMRRACAGLHLPDDALDALPADVDRRLCEVALAAWQDRPSRAPWAQLRAYAAARAAAHRLEAYGVDVSGLAAPPRRASTEQLARYPYRFYGAYPSNNHKPDCADFAVRFARTPTRAERDALDARVGRFGRSLAFEDAWMIAGWLPSSEAEGPEHVEDWHRIVPIVEAVNISSRDLVERDDDWDAWSMWIQPLPTPYPSTFYLRAGYDALSPERHAELFATLSRSS